MEHKLLLQLLLLGSVACWSVPLLVVAVTAGVRRWKNIPYRRSAVSGMLACSACLLGATWCLRFAVGLFAPLTEGLTWWEELGNSFLHALQTFSMDEDYTTYLANGKEMIGYLNPQNLPMAQKLYGIYVSLLNVVAPVAGGAFVFDILAGIFPKLHLFFQRWIPWKCKCYFSSLNPASVKLAKSISDYYTCTMKKSKPVLIFTDAHADGENEQEMELWQEARQIGAICVRDDLAHVPKRTWGQREYYLIDRNEHTNLRTFAALAEEKNVHTILNAKIYLFVESDAYVRLEKQIRRKLEGIPAFAKHHQRAMPTIVPVRGCRNLIHNLLMDVPLYEPLIHRPVADRLQVTIFGSGTIGMEALLGAYWAGQLMGTALHLHVVSAESEQNFRNRLDYINPELRRTMQEGAVYTPDPLMYYNDTQYNGPYCTLKYTEADVKIGSFWTEVLKNDPQLLETDYFIVSLGNDADNIAMAEKIRCAIGKKQLESESAANTVIAYVVFDSALCRALNETKHHSSLVKERADIYMHAFGSLEQVYSCENVMMTKHQMWARATGTSYEKLRFQGNYTQENRERAKDANADYSYWADIARAMHVKYKVFCLGWYETSVFDYLQEKDVQEHREQVQKACAVYKRIAVSGGASGPEKAIEQMRAEMHNLAWLEHRRWNAYTRTMGYQYTDAIKANFRRYNSHKNMRLKLHPCLVEAGMYKREDGEVYMQAKFRGCGDVVERLLFSEADRLPPDRLDQVSLVCAAHRGKTGADYKEYDYFRHEFDGFLSEAQVATIYARSAQWVRRRCERGFWQDMVQFADPLEWYIPEKAVMRQLQSWCRNVAQLEKWTNRDGKELKQACEAGTFRGTYQCGGQWYVPWYRVPRFCLKHRRRS